MIAVEQARSNNLYREQFLNELVRDYTQRIRSMISVRDDRPTFKMPIQEATQTFLQYANRAIDLAILTDDGRGKNDPRKWCGNRGLLGVRKAIHELHKRCAFESQHHMVLDVNAAMQDDVEAYYGVTEDIAATVVGEDIVKQFMLTLTAQEKAVVELLLQGYGPKQRPPKNWHSGVPKPARSGEAHYNYLKTIAKKLGWRQDRVERTFISLRRKAAFLNG